MMGKSRPVRPRAFSLSWANRTSKPATSPARNRVLRHLLPGAWRQRCDQPGRSAEFQRRKNCGKICLDSGRRIGSVSCNLHGRLQSGWFSNLTLPSAPVAIQTPMGSFTSYLLPVSRRTCVKTPRSFHTLVVLVFFRGLRSIRSRKIAKNFRLRDRSHFFHDFLHGLDPLLPFPISPRYGRRTPESRRWRYRQKAARAVIQCPNPKRLNTGPTPAGCCATPHGA